MELQIVEYDPQKHGEYTPLSEEFIEKLKGYPILEQTQFYKAVITQIFGESSYGIDEEVGRSCYAKDLERFDWLSGLIVKDGVVIGIIGEDYLKKYNPIFVNQSYNYYYACENNGSGDKDVDCYMMLVIAEEYEKDSK